MKEINKNLALISKLSTIDAHRPYIYKMMINDRANPQGNVIPGCVNTGTFIDTYMANVFIGPESDHWQCLSLNP